MNQIFSSSERIFTDVWSHFGNFQNAGKRWPKRYSVNPPLPHLVKYGDDVTAFQVTTDVEHDARTLFTALYGQKPGPTLDTLREHMFASHKGDIRSLPPTEDAFHFHMLRALFQLAIYKQAHNSNLVLPDVSAFGRSVVGDTVVPVLMSKSAKPAGVKPSFCRWLKSKCLRRCPCEKANMRCIVACLCFGDDSKCGRRYSSDSSDDDSDN